MNGKIVENVEYRTSIEIREKNGYPQTVMIHW